MGKIFRILMEKKETKLRKAQYLLLITNLLVFLAAIFIPLPYVILEPGPTYNLLSSTQAEGLSNTPEANKIIVDVHGKNTRVEHSHLNMMTVGVADHISLLDGIFAWLSDKEDMMPREYYYPPNLDSKRVNAANKNLFNLSIQNAELAVANYLHYPIYIQVLAAEKNSGLKVGDMISKINGLTVANFLANQFTTTTKKDNYLTIRTNSVRGVIEKNIKLNYHLTSTNLLPVKYQFKIPFPQAVTINLEGVGGPSAGLMLALAILEKVLPETFTKNRFIAGTGTIAPDGKVGPIGGIKYKIMAASRQGAEIFLVPSKNYAEAVAVKTNNKPKLVKVTNLVNALNFLKNNS